LSSEAQAPLERIAAAHTAAFRQVTGKWRDYQGLVKTRHGGTFFPSDVAVFAGLLPGLGLRGRVLEVGSGDGRMLSLLALLRATSCPAIGEVTGVEVVPEYLEVSRRARAGLGPELDFSHTREICANVLELDLHPFDVILYFAGGAMPWREEEVFRTALARELRPDARLLAYGPDAEGFPLEPRGTVAVPGYHSVHVYGGRPGARSAGSSAAEVRGARLGWLAERLLAHDDPGRPARGRMALQFFLERFFPGSTWELGPLGLTVRPGGPGGGRVRHWPSAPPAAPGGCARPG